MTLLKKKTVKKLRKRITKMQRMDGGMDETTTMTKRQRMKTRAPWYPLGFVFVMVLKINAKMSTCIFYWAILSKALSLYSPNRSHLLNSIILSESILPKQTQSYKYQVVLVRIYCYSDGWKAAKSCFS
ncbi:hypothetical protein OIU79_011191 [Salix purpurea]|uniref:Uncharacterized protein n=1 Tax=Salix purpurea TaxID=77065 RepID=A0A9Q0TA81_SALPP|nr:hypothetical protein OIU79_011191 [Salix purpurea]